MSLQSSHNFYADGYNSSRFALVSAKAGELVANGSLYIDDTPGLSFSHIVAECRRVKRDRGVVGMVLVDYLTLMKAEKTDQHATELLLRLNRHGKTGVVHTEQRYEAIYDCDQDSARAKAERTERRTAKNKGGL